jgi:predicted RNA methylase
MRARPLVALLLVLPVLCTAISQRGLAADNPSSKDHRWTFKSRFFDQEVVVLPGVFSPFEAEMMMLPFMKENAALFRGKRVLEIGTGSGVISVYAAKLGATKVVATDIAENALGSLRENAQRFGVSEIVEGRLVPLTDLSAYSVIRPDEQFDVIISNPPYSLDLDATENSAVVDKGDLGFSIVQGLEKHLAPEGTAVLYYGSLFYHLAMVKYARHGGYEVTHHRPWRLYAWEVEPLFNTYLARFLQKEGLPADAFRFDLDEPHTVQWLEVHALGREPRKPLLPGNGQTDYSGMMVLRRPAPGTSPASPTPAAPTPQP